MSGHKFQNPAADQLATCKDCYLPLVRYIKMLEIKNKLYPIFKIETIRDEKTFFFKSCFKTRNQPKSKKLTVKLKKTMHHQSLNVCEFKFVADNYNDVAVELHLHM